MALVLSDALVNHVRTLLNSENTQCIQKVYTVLKEGKTEDLIWYFSGGEGGEHLRTLLRTLEWNSLLPVLRSIYEEYAIADYNNRNPRNNTPPPPGCYGTNGPIDWDTPRGRKLVRELLWDTTEESPVPPQPLPAVTNSTVSRGKINEQKVREIRQKSIHKYTGIYTSLAHAYNVTPQTIKDIVSRKTWKHVQ